MIRITFQKNVSDCYTAFEITGHAHFAEYGEDIVCAAVSTLATTTYNNLIRLAHFEPIIDVEEKLGGFLYVEILSDLAKEQQEITQLLLQALVYGFEDIVNEYPDFVEIVIEHSA